jgi:hypothetical protein
MENFRFIKTLNQIALAIEDQTQLATGVPGEAKEGGSFLGLGESDWWAISILGGMGVFAGLNKIVDKVLEYLGKNKECLKLFGRYLKGPFLQLLNGMVQGVFGGTIGSYLSRDPSTGDTLMKARELWQKWQSSNYRDTLNRAVDNLYSSDPNIEDVKRQLRRCIADGTLDKFIKDLMYATFVSKFPNLPKELLEAIKRFWDSFLNNGDLYAFGAAIAAAVYQFGAGAGEAAYVLAAEVLGQGFVAEYGVGYTVIVGVLTAVFIGLSAFFLAGGTLAGIAAWLSSTASGIISTAAAGAGLSSAAIQRINEIIQQIARQVLPAT